jgi:hypothetical protein
MKIFIIENIRGQLTNRYHDGGGLAVIAKDLEQAKEIIKVDKDILPIEEDWNNAIVYELKDCEVATYYVFPDAGCC